MNILRSSIDRNKRWNVVSDECRDLVAKLMNKKPRERINCKQALSHPFLKSVKKKEMAKIKVDKKRIHWKQYVS